MAIFRTSEEMEKLKCQSQLLKYCKSQLGRCSSLNISFSISIFFSLVFEFTAQGKSSRDQD